MHYILFAANFTTVVQQQLFEQKPIVQNTHNQAVDYICTQLQWWP